MTSSGCGLLIALAATVATGGCKKRRTPEPRTKSSRKTASAPGASRATALTLQRAIARGLVRAELRPGDDRYDKAALLLRPRVKSRPWIRIEPRWRIANPPAAKSSDMVLIASRVVRLHPTANRLVFVPQVQLRPTYRRGGRRGATLERLDGDDDGALIDLLAAVDKRYRALGQTRKQGRQRRRLWEAAQMAVWMQQTDVPLAEMQRTVYGMTRRPGVIIYSIKGVRRLLKGADHLRVAFALLEAAGLDPREYRAYRALQRHGGMLPGPGRRKGRLRRRRR